MDIPSVCWNGAARTPRFRFVDRRFRVEEALLYHLRALHALPADTLVPPRIVVSRRSGEQVVKRVTARPRPAKQLRALRSVDGD